MLKRIPKSSREREGTSKAFWEEMKFQMNLEGCKGLGRTRHSEFVKSINS